jgi:hypothetical protein
MDIYSDKSLAPRKLSGINLGTTPVGTTHGDLYSFPTHEKEPFLGQDKNLLKAQVSAKKHQTRH